MGDTDEKVDISFLASCILAFFLSVMVQTVLQIIFPTIENQLGISSQESNIIIFLPIAALFVSLIPISVLADRFGKRKLFLWGLAAMCVAMICSACAMGFYTLAFARFLTGVAAACLTCTVLSLVTDNSPRSILSFCIGLCAAGSSIGAMSSPFIGNAINEAIGWRWIFVIVLFGLIIAALLMLSSDCVNRPNEGRKMDHGGLLLFAIGAFVFVLGLNKLPAWEGLVLFLVGLAIIIAFFLRESRTGQQTFKLDLFNNRSFLISCLVAVVFYMCMMAVTFWGTVYLIAIDDLPMTQISLLMMIAPLLQALLSPFVAQYGTRFNQFYFPMIGLLIVAVALAMVMFCPYDKSHLEIIVPALVLSAVGFAFFAVENNRTIMLCVDDKDRNFASSMIGSMTALGRYVAMIAVSCTGVVVAAESHFSASDLHSAFMFVFPIMIVLCLLSLVACYKMERTE